MSSAIFWKSNETLDRRSKPLDVESRRLARSIFEGRIDNAMASSQEGAHAYDDFNIGDQVKHPKWGVGTILFRSGFGEAAKVVVVFADEGQKKLALKYAGLKKVQGAKPAVQKAPREEPAVEAPKKDEPEGALAAEGDDEDEEVGIEEIDGDSPFGDDDDEKNIEVIADDGAGKEG